MSMIALAQRLRPGRRGLGRAVLVLVAVTAAIIVGLLAMHSLNNGHTETAAPASAAAIHEHDAMDPGVADHGTSQLGTDGECADCGGHAGMLAMACVLALLSVTLLFIVPRVEINPAAALRAGPAPTARWTRPARPPSLLDLCISRT